MRHLDLFSGIGGFSIASDSVWENVEHIFCDNEPFAQKILRKHWPKSKIYGDIKDLKGSEIGTVDLVTGGFPCQPFSSAGKRKGKEDDRHLWPEMLRVIRETSPSWVIGENVGGLVTWNGGMVLDEVFSDLESEGYRVWAFIIPACAVDAIHRRDRVWVIANHASKRGKKRQVQARVDRGGTSKAWRAWSDLWVQSVGRNTFEFKEEDKPFICGMDNGVPDRVDRLKCLGNTIVPQVAARVLRLIGEIE